MSAPLKKIEVENFRQVVGVNCLQIDTIEMPELLRIKSRVKLAELSEIYYSLKPNTYITHNGVDYKMDYDEHDERLSWAREMRNAIRLEFERGNVGAQEYEFAINSYLNDSHTFHLVDQDGKPCGIYKTDTKECYMFLKRVDARSVHRQTQQQTQQQTLYFDIRDRSIYTYGGSYGGRMDYNMNFISRADELDIDDLDELIEEID